MEAFNESSGGLSGRLDELISEAMAADAADAVATSSSSSPSPDLSSLLGGLAGNPELLSKLPQMMSMLGPMLDGLGGAPGKSGGHPGGAHTGKGTDRHTALLCAVKPYLCAERQAAADQLIRLCKMGDLLQKMPPPQAAKGGDGHV